MNNETIGEQIEVKYDSTNMSIGIITVIYTPQKEAIWTYGALLAKTIICIR